MLIVKKPTAKNNEYIKKMIKKATIANIIDKLNEKFSD